VNTSSINIRYDRVRSSLKFHFNESSWQIIVDALMMWVLFGLSVIFVYKTPQILSKIFFLGLIAGFWFSRKNYFWFALFFILSQKPGTLFLDFSGLSQHRIPLFSILPGMSFSAFDLFVIVALIKALLKGKRTEVRLKLPFILLFAYILFTVLLSVLNGTGIDTLANVLRGPFCYSLVFSFIYLINKRKEAYYFIYLILPFVFFIFFTQVYKFVKGQDFLELFYPGYLRVVSISGTGEIRLDIAGMLLVFFGFVFSLFLIEIKGKTISKNYLYAVVSTAYLIIVLSATRMWFAVFSFILLCYFFVLKKDISNFIKISVLMVFIMSILISSGLFSSSALFNAILPRLSDIFTVAQGDFHSVGTFEYKYFYRLPLLLEGMEGNLVFGLGFSDLFLEYRDMHLGLFNTILQFGIIGFLVFLYFFASYFSLIHKTLKNLSSNNPLRTSLKSLIFIFAGILMASFTNWNFFSMGANIARPFFVSVFLGLTIFFVKDAETEERRLKDSNP